MKLIEGPHPLGVSLGQVIIHSDYMYPPACQGIQIYRKRCHHRFSFPGRHLRNTSLVQYNPANQLYIVMDHVPCDHVATGHPIILPVGLVSFDLNAVTGSCQVPVIIICRNFQGFIFLEPAGRLFDDGKSKGQSFFEGPVKCLINRFFYFFNLLVKSFFLIHIHPWII